MIPPTTPVKEAVVGRVAPTKGNPGSEALTNPVRRAEETAVGARMPSGAPGFLDATPIPAAAIFLRHAPTAIMLLPVIKRVAPTIKKAVTGAPRSPSQLKEPRATETTAHRAPVGFPPKSVYQIYP